MMIQSSDTRSDHVLDRLRGALEHGEQRFGLRAFIRLSYSARPVLTDKAHSMRMWRFRARSAFRDKESDNFRIASIRTAIHTAIAGAELELSGLSKRLDSATASAAFAFDSADDDYATRDKTQETNIRSAESGLVAVEQRLSKLRQHLAALRDLESILNAKFQNEM